MQKTTTLMVCAAMIGGLFAGCGGATNGENGRAWYESSRSRDGNALVEVTRSGPTGCDMATLYFDYDSDELTDRSRDELTRAADCMIRGFALPIQLVGAADPRGTEEYNMALGERRARAVRGYMVRLGVEEAQVSFTTVGEEMARGTNEATWALDRHVMSRVQEAADVLAQPTARR